MQARLLMAVLVVLAILSVNVFAEELGKGEGSRGKCNPKRQDNSTLLTDVPDHSGSVILGRPTANSVTLSLLWYANTEAVRRGVSLPSPYRQTRTWTIHACLNFIAAPSPVLWLMPPIFTLISAIPLSPILHKSGS